EGFNIFNFALDGIGLGVCAAAAPAPVIVDDGIARRQQGNQWPHHPKCAAVERAAHQDNRLPRACLIVGDGCAVFRRNHAHVWPPFAVCRTFVSYLSKRGLSCTKTTTAPHGLSPSAARAFGR